MAPLGCMRDARKALAHELRQLASGGYRDVFVNKKGTLVYKVAYCEREDSANVNEHAASERARKDGVPGIPRTSLWYVNGRPVLCMRRYPSPGEYSGSALLRSTIARWRAAGFFDLHGRNYTVTPSGRPRLLDMQFIVQEVA